MIKKITDVYNDPLFKNSIFLMVTTGVMAILGFLFWMICARKFTAEEIGIATSIISATSLLSYASLFGFNNTFVRLIPSSKNRNQLINAGLISSTIASVVISSLYLLSLEIFSPKLDIILDKTWYEIGFILLVTATTVNLLTDSIFISLRSAKYNLIIDGFIQGIVKIILPFIFVSLGSYGIFLASGTSVLVAMIFSLLLLSIKFNYRPSLIIHTQTLRNIFHYSSINYIANLFNIAPTLILPLIILNKLGPAMAGYYYMAFTVANLLYAIVYSVSSSLFAEGSYGEIPLQSLVKKSSFIIALIILPSTIILIYFGPVVISLFGKSYAASSEQLIKILAFSSPAVAAYTLGNVLLRISHKIYSIIFVNFIYMLSISITAYFTVHNGLQWIGISWLIGNLLASVIAFISIKYSSI